MTGVKPRILHVEDHDDTRELLPLILGGDKYEMISVATIEDGIKVVTTQKFDLYICDLWLGDGSGVDLCKVIRLSSPRTPILIYSAAADPTERAAAFAAGADDYLVKPVPAQKLCEKVSQLIREAA